MSIDSSKEFIDVIEGCLRGDRLSQKSLYQTYYGYGMSVCMHYLSDREEAVEVLNTAFMKVFKNIKKYDITQAFKPWFRRIVVNSAIDQLRLRKMIEDREDLENATYASVEEEATSKIAYQDLLKLIHNLSPAYRTVFNLHVIEGYSHDDISGMLGISVGTSKSNLFKAKAHLKLALEKMGITG